MASHDFYRYATSHAGISSTTLNRYQSIYNGWISPMVIEERQSNVASMDVFSRLMMERIIFLGVPIDDHVANIIQAQLLFLAAQDATQHISMYINSPGGEVYSGLGIYDTMQFIKPDVHTICTGIAASMSAVLLCAGAKNNRSALRHSRVMIHQPMGGVSGQAADIEITARQINKVKNELYDIIAKHSGHSLEEITQDADRDYWMSSKDALSYGMIDKILE